MAALSRRDFLAAAAAGLFAPFAGTRLHAGAQAEEIMFAAAYQERSGGYAVAILSEAGEIVRRVPIPGRGHDITFDPAGGRSVAFARRPGAFAVVFDHHGRMPPLTIPAARGRHFFGHGVFSPDGALLYATEHDYDNAAGMIGVYDAKAGFRRVDEFPTGGMDPHDLLLLPDERTIALANGGIETHPDFGRAKLNLSTMQPSLVFIDCVSGRLLEKHTLPAALHQLSIRHMDIDAGGTVWFGCQHEGPQSERPALVGTARRGEDLRLVDMPDDVLAGMRNYVGSVAANRAAGTVAVTSPQGDRLVVLDTRSHRVIESRGLREVCGVAANKQGFVATTGFGVIETAQGNSRSVDNVVWDNHVLRIA